MSDAAAGDAVTGGAAAERARERLRQAEDWERGFAEQAGLFAEAAVQVALGLCREACGALSDDRAGVDPERLASMAAMVLAGPDGSYAHSLLRWRTQAALQAGRARRALEELEAAG